MKAEPLRLMVYDRTCVGGVVGLSSAWRAGATLYRALGRLDAAFGASSWEDALGWLAGWGAERPIAEIQFWGHGKWGAAFIDKDVLDARSLDEGGPHFRRLKSVRDRLVPGGRALLWLRTCESFGATRGQRFALQLATFFDARVAGHTHVIGVFQSGLHALAPGAVPDWSAEEGLAEGTAEVPVRAHLSHPSLPRTLSCFAGSFPEAWVTA